MKEGKGGGGDYIPIATLSHRNVSCIKMGSDQSHFNVSLIVRDKVTRQCPQTTTFEEKGEPKRIRTEVPLLDQRPNALPLGHTGSHYACLLFGTPNTSEKLSRVPVQGKGGFEPRAVRLPRPSCVSHRMSRLNHKTALCCDDTRNLFTRVSSHSHSLTHIVEPF